MTVTLVDALVLARSQFHHSMNYRSVVVRWRAVPVTDPQEGDAALRAIEDLAGPHWAGLLPLRKVYGPPVASPDLAAGIDVPEHVTAYRRP